jgi:glucokinase
MKITVGVDIGGTNTKLGLVNEHGEIIKRTRFSTKGCATYEVFIDSISKAIRELLEPEHELIGIGIGAPNGNFYSGCVEFAPNMPFEGILPIRDSLKKVFDCEIRLTNDANAAAMGEKIYGAAKDYNDFIVMTLGTGVGSGIYCNGQLVYGHDGFAGELGHVIVYPNGRLCGCGRKGCLEPYANERGVRQTFEDLKAAYPESTLHQEERISGFSISKHALEGDELAVAVFKKTGEYLGFAFANFMAFLSPKAIFLFGGISRAGELIRKPLVEEMERNMLVNYKNKLEVRFSELPEDDAALLGAAALIQV